MIIRILTLPIVILVTITAILAYSISMLFIIGFYSARAWIKTGETEEVRRIFELILPIDYDN